MNQPGYSASGGVRPPDSETNRTIFSTWTDKAKPSDEPRAQAEDESQKQNRRRAALRGVDPTTWTGSASPRRWIVPDWIPRGEVTLLSGNGGVGKSLLAQQLLTSGATQLPWLGLPVERCLTYGFFCEDTSDEHHRRQERINQAYGLSMSDLHDMRLTSWTTEDAELARFDTNSVLHPTALFDDLISVLLETKPGIIVLDTLADVFAGDELKRQHARRFIRQIGGRLAEACDAAVIICSHPSHTGIRDGTGSSGSTGWGNTVRSQLYLSRPKDEDADDDTRTLVRPKANYAAAGDSTQLALKWQAGAIVASGALPPAKIPWADIDAVFKDIERRWHGCAPWSNAPQTRKTGRYLPAWMHEQFGISERTASDLISKWLMNGYLAIEDVDARSKAKGLRVIKLLTQL